MAPLICFSLKLCKKNVTSGDVVVQDDVKRAFYDVCWYAVRGKIKPESLFVTLADAVVSI